MTHIGSFDLRHADLNTTMPWLCTQLLHHRQNKGCYDITWVFGSYAGWNYLASCWMNISAISFAIAGVLCLSYAVIWHHRCTRMFQNPVIREKGEANLVPKKQSYLPKSGDGTKGSLERLFSSKWRSEPVTLGLCIQFVFLLWVGVIVYNVIQRGSWSQSL